VSNQKPQTVLCGAQTQDGTPCRNPVSPGAKVCNAGHTPINSLRNFSSSHPSVVLGEIVPLISKRLPQHWVGQRLDVVISKKTLENSIREICDLIGIVNPQVKNERLEDLTYLLRKYVGEQREAHLKELLYILEEDLYDIAPEGAILEVISLDKNRSTLAFV
jgi:TusA-related sulfurtransferase